MVETAERANTTGAGQGHMMSFGSGPRSGSIPEGCQKAAGGRDREAGEYPRCGAMAYDIFWLWTAVAFDVIRTARRAGSVSDRRPGRETSSCDGRFQSRANRFEDVRHSSPLPRTGGIARFAASTTGYLLASLRDASASRSKTKGRMQSNATSPHRWYSPAPRSRPPATFWHPSGMLPLRGFLSLPCSVFTWLAVFTNN